MRALKEIEKASPEAYKWTREFHYLYEETAPMFGYETRKETKEFDPTSPNGRLMAYVCFNIIQQALAEERERVMGIIKSNSKGAFTDDGGNNCWYVDDLLSSLANPDKE